MSIYPVREDTLLVKSNLSDMDLKNKSLLEMGTGNAEVALKAAKNGAEVTAVDINPEAVQHAEKRFNKTKFDAEIFQSDLFKQVNSKFDFIIFNPPYLKGEKGLGDEKMWRGGKTGLEVAKNFLNQAKNYLNSQGKTYIVLSSKTDKNKIVEKYNLETVDSKKIWFERIFLLKYR